MTYRLKRPARCSWKNWATDSIMKTLFLTKTSHTYTIRIFRRNQNFREHELGRSHEISGMSWRVRSPTPDAGADAPSRRRRES